MEAGLNGGGSANVSHREPHTIKEQDYPDQEILTLHLEAANVALTTLAVKFDYDSVLGDKEFLVVRDELGDLKMALIIIGESGSASFTTCNDAASGGRGAWKCGSADGTRE